MSYAGMAGMRATLGDVSGLIGALDDGDWATASAAAGWTVKDVVAHFGDLLGILASAMGGTLSTDLGIERLNDARIAAKSSWSPGHVVAGLERQQAALLPQLLTAGRAQLAWAGNSLMCGVFARSSIVYSSVGWSRTWPAPPRSTTMPWRRITRSSAIARTSPM